MTWKRRSNNSPQLRRIWKNEHPPHHVWSSRTSAVKRQPTPPRFTTDCGKNSPDEKIKPTIPHSYRSARFTSPFKATINRDSKINADTSLLIVVHFGNDYPAPRGNCCRAKWGQHHIYLRTILAWFLNRAIEKEAAL